MAGSIKSVSVVFQAFTDKFEKKVNKAGKTTSNFAEKADDAGDSMGNFAEDTNNADQSMGNFLKRAAKFAAGFLAIKTVMGGITGAVDKLNQVGKISKTLDVSPDFLRGLDLAASEVGESFDKAQDIVKEFNIRMGEAKTGAGPAVNGLELIGKTIEDFDGMSPEQSFLKVADAISKISDKQRQIFVAGEFFGGAGEDMLALINKGEAGLTQMIEKARALGGPISKEDLKRAEAANAAIKKLGMAWDGIFQQIVIKIAPAVDNLVTGMEGILSLSDDIGAAWNNAARFAQEWADAIYGVEAEDFKEQEAGTFLKEARKMSMKQMLEGLVGTRKTVAVDVTKDAIAAAVKASKAISKNLKTGAHKIDAKEEKGPEFIDTPTFIEAASAQSSRAFDLLNPDKPSSIAGKNAAANEQTAKNTAAMKQKLAILAAKNATVTIIPGG